MRARLRMAAAAMLVLGLSGCGQGGDDRAETVRDDRAGTVQEPAPAGTVVKTEPVTDRLYSSAEIKKALLGVTDLPTGWSARPHDDSPAKDTSNDYASCPQYAAVNKRAAKLDNNLHAKFASPAGSNVDQALWSLAAADAKKFVSDYSEAVAACPKLSGETFDMSLTALSFPELADETFACRVTAKTYGTTVNMDMVLVRRGGVLIMLVHTAAGAVDTGATEFVARRALEKAERVLR